MGAVVKRRPGRPSKLGEKGTTLSAHIPVSLAILLEEVARAQGKSVSEVVREALLLYLPEEAVKLGLSIASEGAPTASGGAAPSVARLRPLDRKLVEEAGEKLETLERMVRELEEFRERSKLLELKPSDFEKALRYDERLRRVCRSQADKYREAWRLHDEVEGIMKRSGLREAIPEEWEERLVGCWKRLRQLHYFYSTLEKMLKTV